MTGGPPRRPLSSGVRRAVEIAVLAALAYLPALTAKPGRMPADTKLYLYFDPGRLVGDAPYSFDPRQFAGWVPHQTISYLWPSGPWYWLFEQVGAPDWVAHRLWIGTVLFAAGLGARWLARLLGIGGGSAIAVAAVYQLTPFVLPYISRTSLMLLPYAALGWIVGLTVKAATVSRWRHAAILALVVATVAAPNATAIAMIVPAPVLWLLHAAWGREITWRRALATGATIGGLCVAVSVWWLSMLAVQGRYGADVLAYSETLEAVSLTSTSVETLRAMGYWLFYVRDPIGFTTTAAEDYMASGRYVVTSFLLTALGLLGLALVRFRARRYAVLLVIVGIVLAVGVHPIDDPSLLMAPFAESSRSTFVLALRSSTRALPMSVLGLALGAGALVAAAGRALERRARPWTASVPAVVVVALALVNLPAAFDGGFVDPRLERDEDPPAAWSDAAADLDALDEGYRVLQVPGAEFGAFRWGYTVDPPLPGLTERPLVTRDLLPLGSPAAMDLLYALDDRFQEGTIEPASVAPIARLLGADTVWVTNDVWYDRFRTPRPEITADMFDDQADGFGQVRAYGEEFVPTSVLEMVDEQSLGDPRVGRPLDEVWLVPVEDPVPVVRVKTEVVAVAGSGDGLVDAAAAGLVDGSELVVYTAALPDDAVPGRVIVTDANRDQARQWRGSQDTRGFTEEGGDEPGVLRDDSADQRLDVFGDRATGDHVDASTVALQDGPVHAAASAYGEPFAYRPEDRAVMAVDGDLSTAWRVADRAPAEGEFIEIDVDEPIADLLLVQPGRGTTGATSNRWITAVDVAVDGRTAVRIELDERSRSAAGQNVVLPEVGRRVRLTIAATASARPEGVGADAVGFAEIDAGLGATTEVVRVPVDWHDVARRGAAVDVVLTRLRTEGTDRWRHDPEPALVRSVPLPDGVTLTNPTATVRLSPRALDTVLAPLLGANLATASERLAGVPASGGWAAVDGDPATAWSTPFGRPTGQVLTIALDAPAVGALRLRQPGGDRSTITSVRLGNGASTVEADVPAPDADGWSTVTFAELELDGTLTLEVATVDVTTTRDRRSAELVELPAAIADLEIDGLAPAALPDQVDLGCPTDLLEIDGAPVGIALGTVAAADLLAGRPVEGVIGCDAAITDAGADGTLEVVSTPGSATGLDVDRVTFASDAAPPAEAPIRVTVGTGRLDRSANVRPCPEGCWIVLGEGINAGWSASVDGESLGSASLVDGGFGGWWLPPSGEIRTVTFRWTPQPTVTLGLLVSGVGVIGCIVLAVVDRRRAPTVAAARPRLAALRRDRRGVWWVPAVVTGLVALLVVGPVWALLGFALGALAGVTGRARGLAGVAFLLWGAIGTVVLWRVVRYRPFPSASWPGVFEDLHRPGMFVLALLAGSLAAHDTALRRSAARRAGSITDS